MKDDDFGCGRCQAYGARFYDPSIGRFISIDPASESFSSLTPYNYVGNNPLIFIDPTGAVMSPIYDNDGNFLGTDSEGFSGDIVVMSKYIYNRLTSGGQNTLDNKLTKALAANTDVASVIDVSDLSAEGVSKVLTHVVSQMEGEIVNGDKLELDRLEGGIINVIDFPVDEEGAMGFEYGDSHGNPSSIPIIAEAMTTDTKDGKINVTTSTLAGKSQFRTVEHAQSVLGVHEYYGHGVKGVPGAFPAHSASYRYEFNHKRTYNKLSPSQKARINDNKN